MFQGYEQTLTIPFPNKGINITSSNDSESAKYLQNILLGHNNTGQVRYGTYLQNDFVYNPNRIFRNIIHGTCFLKTDGTSENIAYVNYISELPYIDVQQHVTLIINPNNPNSTTIKIDVTGLNQTQKDYFNKVIFNGVYFYVSQAIVPNGADIYNVNIDFAHNIVEFDLPFPPDFFNLDVLALNNFTLWFERAGIYKEGLDNKFNAAPLVDDLDPNVVISSINYQNHLLIANGVDPIQVYDGNTIVPLTGNASVAINGGVVYNNNIITVNVSTLIKQEYITNITVGSTLTLVSQEASQSNVVAAITFTDDIANNLTAIAITCTSVPIQGIRNILYKKPIPPFNYLSVGHDRLWALAEGRPLLNQFRPPNLCQKVYFAAKQGSVFDWFNEQTANIDFIDLSKNNYVPENLEVIKFLEGKMLFIGRHTTQIWGGNDPTANFNGQNINLGNFVLERVIPIGIFQKSLCQEMANNFAIISTFGKSFSFYLNKYGQIDYAPNFIDPIRDYLEAQLSFIENDREYRAMTTFFYPYSDLLGIKIRGECLIFQIKNKGFWTTFSENFSEAKSFLYNEINKNLYIGMANGTLLCYADKLEKQVFTDLDIVNNTNKKLLWKVVYPWIDPQTTWHNSAIFLACTALRPLIVNTKVSINNSETDPIDNEIEIKQIGARFDADKFSVAVYSYQPTEYAYKSIRFFGDSFSLEFNGFVDNLFIFNKIILAGGTQDAN